MPTKRPIDIHRDAATSMQVGDNSEGEITELITLNERLLVVKEKAVYEIILADDMDPSRSNFGIPNAQQKILSIGAESEVLRRSLLTSNVLLKPNFLSKINCARALSLSLELTFDLSAMVSTFEEINSEEIDIQEQLKDKALKSGFKIPTIKNFEAQIKSFIQQADHTIVRTLDIARLFYGPVITHADKLADFIETRHGAESNFARFLKESTTYIKGIRDIRNAIEHPKPDTKVILQNIRINSANTLTSPTIELKHPTRAQAQIDFVFFMGEAIGTLSSFYETLLAYMCDHHASIDGKKLHVIDGSESKSSKMRPRLCYAMELHGDLIPFA